MSVEAAELAEKLKLFRRAGLRPTSVIRPKSLGYR